MLFNMIQRIRFFLFLVVLFASAIPAETQETSAASAAALDRIEAAFTGDLPQIIERRQLRVLVSYSLSNYFLDLGTEHGFEYELLSKYDEDLNQGRPLSKKIVIVFIPVPLEKLLGELRAGRGDIAAGGLTVTKQRQELVAFTRPYIPDVREIVVSGPGAPPIKTLDDLSGHKVWVRAGSSYADHLRSLSTRLTTSGASPIEVIEAPNSLTTEDILEMVNSGIVKLSVADQHIANAWAGVLTDLQVHENLVVHSGGSIAWAVRKENPELRASLDTFIGTTKKGTLLGNILFNRYFKGSKWIANPIIKDHQERLEQLREVFQKYGKMYG
ncbi:MAG: transporter substrate-binding domain-containing protein, partial [Acidobacteria bacterium]|nr:transporter substrate-binding domain-containing protein [Candidatus Sulfomarinibacter sp. MAG AM2]